MGEFIQESDDFYIVHGDTEKKMHKKIFGQKLLGIKLVHHRSKGNYMRLFFENGSVLEATWGIGDFNAYLQLDVIK